MKAFAPVIVSLSLLAGDAVAQTKPSTTTPMVVTASGAPVGRYVVSGHGEPAVLVNFGKKVVVLSLRLSQTSGFDWGGGQQQVFYTTNNCTGPAYLRPNNNSGTLVRGTVLQETPDTPARGLIQTGPAQTLTWQSFFYGGSCNASFSQAELLFPLVEVALVSPPLYIQ